MAEVRSHPHGFSNLPLEVKMPFTLYLWWWNEYLFHLNNPWVFVEGGHKVVCTKLIKDNTFAPAILFLMKEP
jgi:hypothetical protein